MQLSAIDETSGFHRTEIMIDGGPWEDYQSDIEISDNGNHIIEYRSVDIAGNLEEVHKSIFGIDTIPPLISDLAGTQYVNETVNVLSISWTSSDPTSGGINHSISIDGSAFIEIGTNTTWEVMDPEPGNHMIMIRAFDRAGNMAVEYTSALTSSFVPIKPNGSDDDPPDDDDDEQPVDPTRDNTSDGGGNGTVWIAAIILIPLVILIVAVAISIFLISRTGGSEDDVDIDSEAETYRMNGDTNQDIYDERQTGGY
jgi:hypothetical protein